MQLHLLLSNEQQSIKPDEVKIINDFGRLTIIIDGGQPTENYETGLHCFVEGDEEIIFNWLSEFNYFWKGDGNPMMESFQQHTYIDDNTIIEPEKIKNNNEHEDIDMNTDDDKQHDQHDQENIQKTGCLFYSIVLIIGTIFTTLMTLLLV